MFDAVHEMVDESDRRRSLREELEDDDEPEQPSDESVCSQLITLHTQAFQ